ncbi:hypothetical protein FBU59_002620, partial [Linderina macrospora]
MPPTLSDFDKRPRSWSAQEMDFVHRLRPQSSALSAKDDYSSIIRHSTSIGLGRPVSQPSSPSIAESRAPSVRARTFTARSRPATPVVEALTERTPRGEIIRSTTATVPAGTRAIRRNRNNKALEVMRPLVASKVEEDVQSVATTVTGSERRVSVGSDTSIGGLAKPVVSIESPEPVKAGEQNASLLWAALSRLTIRRVKAESAVDRLKDIEAGQAKLEDTVKGDNNPACEGDADSGETGGDISTTQIKNTVSSDRSQPEPDLSLPESSKERPSSTTYWGLGWWTSPSAATAELAAPAEAPSDPAATDDSATAGDSQPPSEGENVLKSCDQRQSVDISESAPVTVESNSANPAAQPTEDSLPPPEQPEPEQPKPASSWWWPLLGSRSADTAALAASEVLPTTADTALAEQNPVTSPSDPGEGVPMAVVDNELTQGGSSGARADESEDKAPESKAGDAAVSGHNLQQQQNMLLPTLEFTDIQSSPPPEHQPPSPSKRKSTDPASLADTPLSKRLRIFGRTLYDSAYEIAPEWARTFVDGQKLADTAGQHHGPLPDDRQVAPTAAEINAAMGAGARTMGRIAVIGIHGWFPTKMLQMVAGEPTGKSEKFCVMMRDALHAYLSDNHGVEIGDADVSLFPLVGEGRIEDRVDLLLSQIVDPGPVPEEIREALEGSDDSSGGSSGKQDTTKSNKNKKKKAKRLEVDPSLVAAESLMPERTERATVLGAADTVFVVTHSQGTPVSALLLERLMELGLVNTQRQRVCMLAMAGISHGPMPYLRDNVVIRYIESEAARELFELMDPSSPLSQRYVAALSTILHKGVRLVSVGSWVDEVVPLYSGILQGVSHPNVYRAVYIDAPHYLDDFLTNLIVFGLRLRNMGLYDHDLLIHLSEVVAGSLW